MNHMYKGETIHGGKTCVRMMRFWGNARIFATFFKVILVFSLKYYLLMTVEKLQIYLLLSRKEKGVGEISEGDCVPASPKRSLPSFRTGAESPAGQRRKVGWPLSSAGTTGSSFSACQSKLRPYSFTLNCHHLPLQRAEIRTEGSAAAAGGRGGGGVQSPQGCLAPHPK